MEFPTSGLYVENREPQQSSGVICDLCFAKVEEICYHCPKEKTIEKHPQGFDICEKCAKFIHDHVCVESFL